MPFEVSINESETHPVITLRNTDTRCFAEVYTFGALLNKFAIDHHAETVNVIDGFDSVAEAIKDITPAFKSAKLSPFVCRIKEAKYHFGEADYELTKYSMGKNAIHGLVYDQVFSIEEKVGNDDEAMVRLQYKYDNQNEGYPFNYTCEVIYQLQADHTLQITTNIYNTDDKLIPVADGWHPYFTLGDTLNDYQLEFQSKELLEFDKELIPTGKLIPYQEFGSLKQFGTTWFDNCFTVNFAECQPMCVVRNPKRSIQVEIHPSPAYPYLQFYTPDHRKSIAIENLSAAPDALNNSMGLHVLEAGQSISFVTKFVIKQLN